MHDRQLVYHPISHPIDLSQKRIWYNYWYTCMRTTQMNWYSCTFTRADVIKYTRSLKTQSVLWDKIFLTTSSSKITNLFLNDFLFTDRHHLTLVINVSIFPSHDRSRDDGGEDEEVLVLLWDVTAAELQRHSSFSHGELSAWRPRHEILDTSTRVAAFHYDQVSLEPSWKSERQSAFVLPCRRPDQLQTQINTQNCTLQNYRNSSPSNRSAARRRTRMEGKGRETQKKETKKRTLLTGCDREFAIRRNATTIWSSCAQHSSKHDNLTVVSQSLQLIENEQHRAWWILRPLATSLC